MSHTELRKKTNMSSGRGISPFENATLLGDSKKPHETELFSQNTETSLLRACKSGELKLVEQLLQNGADIQERDDAISALSWSAQSGHVDVVECLLELGVDPNLPDGDGATPLQHAAERGHLEVVRCLAERGALADAAAGCGPSALSRAARAGHLGAAQLLVEAGARVDGGGGGARGRTPLREAVDARRGRVLKYLLGQGADVDARDEDGVTALHTLIQGQRWAEARLLLTHGAQLRSGGPGDNHALSALIGARQWDMAECLVARGADIQHLSTEEKTALLHHVIGETLRENTDAHNAFYRVIRLGNIQILELLIERLGLQSSSVYTDVWKAYEEIRTRNVPMLGDMTYFIENMFIELKVLTKRNSGFVERCLALDEVHLLIDDTTEIIKDVTRNYCGTNEGDRTLALSTYVVARNIHILKKTLRGTYQILPWEEMEFCLINFMQYLKKVPYQDEMCRLLADKERLYSHLRYFRAKLIEIKPSLSEADINSKITLPGRSTIIQNIVATNPQFQNLYSDYEVIRNVYSLQKIDFYLNIVVSVDLCEDNEVGILAIQRALQVMGEYLKNTPESPHISDDIHKMLLNSAPRYVKRIITSLRDTLSHADSLMNKMELEEDKESEFFKKVQNDIKKIGIETSTILYKKKIETLNGFLVKMTQCASPEEMEYLARRFCECGFDRRTKKQIRLTEFENLQELLCRLNNETKAKPHEDLIPLQKIKEIINAEESKLERIENNYENFMAELRRKISSIFCHRKVNNFVMELGELTTEDSPLGDLNYILSDISYHHCDFNTIEALHKVYTITGLELQQVQGIEGMQEDIKRNENKCERIIIIRIQDAFNSIENSAIPEKSKNKYKKVINTRIRIHKAKQTLTAYLDKKVKGVTCDLLIEKDYAQAVEDLTLKTKTKNHLQKCWSQGDFTSCLGVVKKVDDKYGILLNTMKEISFFSLDKYVKAFESFFVEGGISPESRQTVIHSIHENHKERILQHFEKRLSSLERITKLQTKGPVVQAAMEMLVLDLTEVLEHSGLLVDNYTFLLGNTPLLTGKSLRNYLAHGNLLVDLLPFSTSTAIATHAKVLLEKGKELITRRDLLLGSPCAVDISQTRERHAQILQVLTTQREMFTAAEKGDLEGVKDSIERGADPKARSMKGLTAQDVAVRGDRVDVFKFLVDTNLSIDVENVLDSAVLSGSINIVKYLTREYCLHLHGKSFKEKNYLGFATSRGHASIVKYALESCSHECYVDTSKCIAVPCLEAGTDSVYDLSESLLHVASLFGCREVVRLFLQRGAKVDSRCNLRNSTALHLASLGGHLEVVEELLNNGSDVNLKNSRDEGPLNLAIAFCHYHVAQLLVQKGAMVKVLDEDGSTALQEAARDGQIDFVRALLNEGALVNEKNKDGTTALHYASVTGRVDVVRELLAHNADVDARHKEWLITALHCATKDGHKEVVKELLLHGSQIEARDILGRTALHLACEEGHVDVVLALLAEGADVGSKCLEGKTPLHCATSKNRREVVRILLEHGADVDTASILKHTALHIATKNGFGEIALLLLSRGANARSRTNHGLTPLHNTCDAESGGAEMVNALVANRCDVDARDEKNRTALHRASSLGRRDVVRALINAGADVNALDCNDATPLYVAASRGHKDVAELLVTCFNINNVTRNSTPLKIACVNGFKDIVLFLLAKGAGRWCGGQSALHTAALYGHSRVVDVLLSNGAQVDERDRNDCTALWTAVGEGHKEAALLLLARGADVDASNGPYRHTALHEATRLGLCELVEALLEKGADANAASTTGATALHFAAELGHAQITRVLLAGRADPTPLDEGGRCPLGAAAAQGHADVVQALADADPKRTPPARALFAAIAGRHVHAARALLRCGAPADAACEGLTALQVAALENLPGVVAELAVHGADVNASDGQNGGLSPLHFAAIAGGEGAATALLDSGARVNACCPGTGSSALHLAAEGGHEGVVRTLLARGADAGLQDVDGLTALHAAAARGHAGAVAALLDGGADVHAASPKGATALHAAARSGHAEVTSLLLDRGADADARDSHCRAPLHFASSCGSEGGDPAPPALPGASAASAPSSSPLLAPSAAVTAPSVTSATASAAAAAAAAAAALLASSTCRVDARDEDLWTPLHDAAITDNVAACTLLLQHGADVNAVNTHGCAPLHLASGNGCSDAAAVLLESGALLDTRDCYGATPLFLAAREGHCAVAAALLQRGADGNAPNAEGASPLHAACEGANLQMAQILLDHCANPNARDGAGRRPLDIVMKKAQGSPAEDESLGFLLEILTSVSELSFCERCLIACCI